MISEWFCGQRAGEGFATRQFPASGNDAKMPCAPAPWQRQSHLQQRIPSPFIAQKLHSLWKLFRLPKSGKRSGERPDSPPAFRSRTDPAPPNGHIARFRMALRRSPGVAGPTFTPGKRAAPQTRPTVPTVLCRFIALMALGHPNTSFAGFHQSRGELRPGIFRPRRQNHFRF